MDNRTPIFKTADADSQEIGEYRLDEAIYCVDRIFGKERTIKDILLETISSRLLPLSD